MKVKPIFIVRVPDNWGDESLRDLSNKLMKIYTDYHHLIIVQDIETVEFEVFYEKDFNEVKYKELKAIVTNMTKE